MLAAAHPTCLLDMPPASGTMPLKKDGGRPVSPRVRREKALTYKGLVKNGVIVLDGPSHLKDGDRVSVRPLRTRANPSRKAKRRRTLYDRLKSVVGKAKGLPPDAALNHDHYLYGLPRK